MRPCVLDASVAMRWIDASNVPKANEVRRRILAGEIGPWVPVLWHWEMANGIAVLERRAVFSAEGAMAAWTEAQLWADKVKTDAGPRSAASEAFHLARRYRLTAYDAGYLELALRLRAPLATLDQELARAAERAGVELI